MRDRHFCSHRASEKKNVVNRGCFLQVDLQFHPQIDSTTHTSTDKTALSHDRESRGFFRLSGVNSNVCVSWADKNSYYLISMKDTQQMRP